MARKVFLSFLGTTNYTEVTYFYKERKIKTPFSPVASLSFFASDFNPNDEILFFVTEEAEQKNRNNIEQSINYNNIKGNLRFIPIKKENSQENIWDNFQLIYVQIQENDRIIFDITYGFRAVPMLFMVLANYVKFLKNAEIIKVLYGAFEARDRDNNTPIWDLTNFSLLQEWTNASGNFINFGSTDSLMKITRTLIINKNPELQSLNELTNIIDKIANLIRTNRKKEIIKGEIFKDFNDKLKNVQKNLVKPYQPLLEKVENYISEFSAEQNIENGFIAVKWCIRNKLVQQGITLLQENILSYILAKLNKDWENKFYRRVLSSCLSIKEKEEYCSNSMHWDVPLVNEFYSSEIFHKFKKLYMKINNDFRNDINHAGITNEPKKENKFFEVLVSSYEEIQKIISEIKQF